MKPTSLKRNSFYENLYQLDRILRGDATRPEHLRKAEIEIPIVGISVTIICLAVVYGFCMGVFALIRGFDANERFDVQSSVTIFIDAAGDVSFALRVQRFGGVEVKNGSRVEVVDCFALGQHCRTRVNGTNPCVLQFKHAQLRFHCDVECDRFRRRGNIRTGVLDTDLGKADKAKGKEKIQLWNQNRLWSTSDRCTSDFGEFAKAAPFHATDRPVPPEKDGAFGLTCQYGFGQFRVARLLLLVGSLLSCRLPDGLGVAAVHWQPRPSFRVVSGSALQLFRGRLKPYFLTELRQSVPNHATN